MANRWNSYNASDTLLREGASWPTFRTTVWKLVPLRKQGTFLLGTPLREYWTRMMVYVGEKV